MCKTCNECVGATLKQQIRLSYVLFDTIFAILAIVIVYGLSTVLTQSDNILRLLRDYVKCPADEDLQCLGISAVYRISLSLVIVHVFVLFWLLFRNSCSKNFNEGVWLVKILMVVGTFIGFFFVSNSVFEVYSKVIMVLSVIFLLFQIIMIIDLFYIWGTRWIQRYDAGQKGYAYPLIGFSAILIAATLYVIIRSYIWFAGCGVGTLGVTLTLALIVLSLVFLFARTNPNGSLLTCSAVAAYSMFLTWSGLSNMHEECNPVLYDEATTIVHLVFGALIILVVLFYLTIGTSEKSSGFVAPGGVDIAKGVLVDNTNEPKPEYKDEEKGKPEAKQTTAARNADLSMYQNNGFIYFHIVMIFACFYFAMILSNWGQAVVKGGSFFQLGASELGMWIKLGAAWATMALYNWTLIAPKIFPNRDFS